MLIAVDRRISVLVAVAPRLLGDTLTAALRDTPEFDVVARSDGGTTAVDAAVVTGHCPSDARAPVVLELPSGSEWTGSGWLEVGGRRRQVAPGTLDAVCDLLREQNAAVEQPPAAAVAGVPTAALAPDEFALLLRAAQRGDGAAVTRLYRDHNPSLLRYLRSRAPSDAEDLASETWMGVARGLADFNGNERAFRGWVFAIARNRLAGHYRSPGRHRSDPWPNEALAEHDSGVDVAEEALRGLPADAAIAELVAGLSEEMAEVVRLRVVAGLTAAETAALMGRSEGAVRVLQHRALRRLAKRFAHRHPADLL